MQKFFSLGNLGFVFLATVLVVAGCGDGSPPLAAVEGDITLDGNPVGQVVLTFSPTSPGGTVSYGETDSKGHYKLMFTDTKAGAMLGQHKVTFEQRRYSKDELTELKASGVSVSEAQVIVPKKYLKDGETAEVKKGSNKIDFTWTSK
jgi:hypothetical protein